MTTKTIKTERSLLANVKLTMSVLCLTLVFASSTYAATYYINYEATNDSGLGTSKATAWKRHPYMNGFAGTYTHQAGDQFIFKGRVTWPNAAFPLTMNNGGNASASDYYGVDQTWYSGTSWDRPIFDAGGSAINNGKNPFIKSSSYVVIDNLEFSGFYWDLNTQGWGTSMLYSLSCVYVTIKNCYFHNWSHASAASGCLEDLSVIFGGSGVLDNCIFDGSPNGTDSGCAVSNFGGAIRNLMVRNCSNGIIPCGDNAEVSGCHIGPIPVSFDPAAHGNGIEPAGGCGTVEIFNNVIHDCTEITILTGSPGDVSYIYNNLIYNAATTPIQLDGRGTPATTDSFEAYIYNNTIVGNGQAIRCDTGPWGTADIRNNHFIGGYITIVAEEFIDDHNLFQTEAEAAADGYTLSNLFSPSTADAPTVNSGVSLASIFETDKLGISRPQGSGWDKGAYEYVSGPLGSPTVTRTRTPILTATPTFTQTPIVSITPPIQTATATSRVPMLPGKDMIIFPNPAESNSVTIQFQAENAGPAEVVVHNVAGRLVSRRDISIASPGRQTVQYRVDKLVNGVYVVTIRQAGKSLGIKRLVVKRAGK